MKKILLFLITLFSITLTNAQLSAGAVFSDSLYDYQVTTDTEPGSPNTVSITAVTTGATLPSTLVIPASVTEDGFEYAITLIASTAIKGKSITSLTLEGNTQPGHQSFMDCTSLTTVTLPLTTTIGLQAFRNCSALVTLNIPEVTHIGVQSFRACTSLVNLNLPKVKFIGETTGAGLAFWQSTGIKTVSMPNIEAIYVGAFNGCTSLESVTLPATLTTLDQTNHNLFKFCSSLTEIIVEGETPITLTDNGLSSIFEDPIAAGAILTVPNGTKSAYEAADVWKNFATINEAPTLSNTSLEELDWSIYVNPVTSVISVTNSNLKSATISVYNLTGKTLLTKQFNSKQSDINISELATGIYLFKVETDNGAFVKKIIKQ
ncbi:leucine-rich repeat domain-containing protein [Wenyingzhuangia aestuarii]|uniref:leucine-rich repeat domain-containing protein n=1 Tax=Wenyingzhuangia aestuarii TaxID=1647582 RepID=UPI00143A24CA|nr:leucine-rich repeat domain-containing protein [Wenyingzhuangia aestuarii]NJB81924.1 hypothetical protein [Wenyingzhuangia aestuarii]